MTSNLSDLRIGFIGAGRMATALARGLIRAGANPAHVCASDPVDAAARAFESETGAKILPGNQEVVGESTVVVLAVKPQYVSRVVGEVSGSISEQHLVVSIAAGVSISQIESDLQTQRRIVRVMPNTPCLIGAGAAAVAAGSSATEADAEFVKRLMETVGVAMVVPESQLDAVTGLSGSGPAYVYQIIEALSDGGVRMGLPRDTSTRLAAQTVLGAARMVLETGEHPGALKDAVTSPGGTTIAGLHALEEGGLRASLMNAVQAATNRSRGEG